MVMYRVYLFLILSACLCSCTKLAHQPQVEKPQVTLDNSRVFEVFSPSLKQNFRVQVRLPGNYQVKQNQNYPLIVKVDGQWDFLLAANTINCIYFDGQMPEAILVGVDWGDVGGDIHAIRSRDLLPEPVPGYPNSGHAKEFTQALADEIIPAVEQQFRSNGQRFLLGGSWGGLYVTYGLLERPDAFDGAVAIAGAYGIAKDKLKSLVAQHQHSNQLQNKRLYIAGGELDDMFPQVKEMAETIEQAKLSGFNLMFEAKPGYGHSGMNVPGYANGFRFMFQRPALPLADSLLHQYAGTYQSANNPNEVYKVQVNDHQLEVKGPNNMHFALLAEAENQFYRPGIFLDIAFQPDGALVTTFFGETQFKKISE